MSPQAFKRIKARIRQRKVTHWCGKTPKEVAKALNPAIRGWLNYYGHFGRAGGIYVLCDFLD